MTTSDLAIRVSALKPVSTSYYFHKELPHELAFPQNSMPEEILKRVFICYTDREPDSSLARQIHGRITTAGHHCFMAAESMKLGDKWPEKTDLELRECDYFLLLLSTQSAASSFVAEELRRAKKLHDDRRGDRPQILPVRLGSFQDNEIGINVAGNTEPFQFITWRSNVDNETVFAAILDVLGKRNESRPQPAGSSSTLPPLGVSTRVGLSVSQHKTCVGVLRQCWELRDRHSLQTLFGIYPLTRYPNAIPLEAQTQVQLIEGLIHNLVTYPSAKGQPLLDLVSTLRDKREPTEPDWNELDELLRQLEQQLRSQA